MLGLQYIHPSLVISPGFYRLQCQYEKQGDLSDKNLGVAKAGYEVKNTVVSIALVSWWPQLWKKDNMMFLWEEKVLPLEYIHPRILSLVISPGFHRLQCQYESGEIKIWGLQRLGTRLRILSLRFSLALVPVHSRWGDL